jgi:hypothetical protein
VTAFQNCLETAQNGGGSQLREYDTVAFNNYRRWFLESTRIEIVNRAYDEEILEEPIVFDDVSQSQYNRLVR